MDFRVAKSSRQKSKRGVSLNHIQIHQSQRSVFMKRFLSLLVCGLLLFGTSDLFARGSSSSVSRSVSISRPSAPAVTSSRASTSTISKPAEWIQEALNKTQIAGKTQSEVERDFKQVCQDYKDSIKKTRKVIAYLVQMSGTAWEGEGDDKAIIKQWNDISFFHGDLALGLGYKVLIETDINGKKTYRTTSSNRFEVTEDHKIIPWSEKAEQFFARANMGLQDLMLNIDKFFSDEKRVIEYIAANKNLLTFKKEK
jgi:hypothetical protein